MIILEMQYNVDKDGQETRSSIKTDEPDEAKAEQKYHQTLSYAAVSKITHHTVALLTDYLDIRKKETYHHDQQEAE